MGATETPARDGGVDPQDKMLLYWEDIELFISVWLKLPSCLELCYALLVFCKLPPQVHQFCTQE